VVAVAVQPDLGAVLGLVAVDVEVHLGVGDGGDPARSLLELLCCLIVVLCVVCWLTSTGRCRSSTG
jgi:hypothetical protein